MADRYSKVPGNSKCGHVFCMTPSGYIWNCYIHLPQKSAVDLMAGIPVGNSYLSLVSSFLDTFLGIHFFSNARRDFHQVLLPRMVVPLLSNGICVLLYHKYWAMGSSSYFIGDMYVFSFPSS